MADLPLEGVRVLELGQIIAAPFAAMMLGDMGAEVLKIEVPDGGDVSRSYGPYKFGPTTGSGQALSYYFCAFNRNKKSLTLNLKHEGAKEVLRKLIQESDVFLHNSLAASMERLGFSYEQVRPLNPRLIYGAISGFGKVGPEKDTSALDMTAQALSGIMSLTGAPEGAPMRAGVPIADLVAGMFLAYGVMTALWQREKTGQGQTVDTSLLEGSAALLTYLASQYFASGQNPQRLGNAHPSIAPYDAFACADGYIAIAVANQGIWERFCRALGLEALAADERFADGAGRSRNRQELQRIIEKRFCQSPAQELVELLRPAGVPCGEVRELATVFADEQAQALGLKRLLSHPEVGEIPVVPPPYHLSAAAGWQQTPPPRLGEHTGAVLKKLGYSDSDIERLRAEGAA